MGTWVRMDVYDEGGQRLQAGYGVEPEGELYHLLFESRGGPKTGPDARNPDYADALELLLARLGQLGATLIDALVD